MPPAIPPSIRLAPRAVQVHLEGFVQSLKRHAQETRGTYERALREFLRWYRRDRRHRLGHEDIVRYRTYLLQERKLSSVSVSTYMTAVRRFGEYLVGRKVLPVNPARKVAGASRPVRHSRQPLSREEVRAVVDAVAPVDELGLRDLAFIKLMLFCGLSEIEIVRADRIDLSTAEAGWVLRVQGKGKVTKDAAVPLPRDVRDVLDQYLSVRVRARDGDPLFASAGNRTRGSRMTTRGVRERVNHYLEIAGVKQGRLRRITPFSLRHTAARMMAEAGASPDEIRDRMRLGSVATAMLYLPSTDGDDKDTTPPKNDSPS